jgi:myo-inositol-1(or 4)-monophosphatase
MQTVSLAKTLKSAVAAAKAAGVLMRQNLSAVKRVNAETSHDIKLELDVRCQKLIERQLHRAFPQIAFLGEEDIPGATSPTDAEFRWVVDPIDGTVNFAHGLPHAGVSIALQQKVSGARGQGSGGGRSKERAKEFRTVAGVVYDPFMNELWTAIRGRQARLNGKVIHVSRERQLDRCIVTIGFAKHRQSLERALPYFNWLARRVRKIRIMGSAALGLTYVATGRLDAYVERGVNLWDIAAGGLILECAGGTFWHEAVDQQHKFRMIASNGLVQGKLPVPK